MGKEESCNNSNEGDLCAMRNKVSLFDPIEQCYGGKLTETFLSRRMETDIMTQKIY